MVWATQSPPDEDVAPFRLTSIRAGPHWGEHIARDVGKSQCDEKRDKRGLALVGLLGTVDFEQMLLDYTDTPAMPAASIVQWSP